jgi:hypothetical protein
VLPHKVLPDAFTVSRPSNAKKPPSGPARGKKGKQQAASQPAWDFAAGRPKPSQHQQNAEASVAAPTSTNPPVAASGATGVNINEAIPVSASWACPAHKPAHKPGTGWTCLATLVVGLKHRGNAGNSKDALAAAREVGVKLQREATNPVDPNAIQVGQQERY